jgi:putative flippase GtrA
MTLTVLIVRYALFAAIATIANLGVQRLVLGSSEQTLRYLVAIAAGTLAGLVIKYILDKRWIFYDLGAGLTQHGTKFTLYTAMGLVTTAIFWGSETLFWYVGHNDRWRELGAILGLAIGYVVKYRLDRRFVFTNTALQPKGSA